MEKFISRKKRICNVRDEHKEGNVLWSVSRPLNYLGKIDRHVKIYHSSQWNHLVSLHEMAEDNWRLLQRTLCIISILMSRQDNFLHNWYNLKTLVHRAFKCYRFFHSTLRCLRHDGFCITGMNNYHDLVIGPRAMCINQKLFFIYLDKITLQCRSLKKIVCDQNMNSVNKHNLVSINAIRVNKMLDKLIWLDDRTDCNVTVYRNFRPVLFNFGN